MDKRTERRIARELNSGFKLVNQRSMEHIIKRLPEEEKKALSKKK